MNKKSLRLLQHIAQDFKERHSDLISALPHYKISIIQLIDLSSQGIEREHADSFSTNDALEELKARGYIYDTGSIRISLTEAGLREGTRGKLSRTLHRMKPHKSILAILSIISSVLTTAYLILEIINISDN